MNSSRAVAASGGAAHSRACWSGDSKSAGTPDAVAVVFVDTQEFANHGGRQREGEIVDDVSRLAVHDRLEQFVDELGDVVTELADERRAERLAHEPAQAGVIGSVAVEEAVRLKVG